MLLNTYGYYERVYMHRLVHVILEEKKKKKKKKKIMHIHMSTDILFISIKLHTSFYIVAFTANSATDSKH